MAEHKLRVGVSPVSPFIIKSFGKYSGFEIELWESLAKSTGYSFEYKETPFQNLLPLLSSGKVDVALAAITINEKREESVDFSQPTFNSGLRILLSKERTKVNLWSTLRSFLAEGYKQLLKPLLVLIGIVIVFGHIVWFAESSYGSFSPSYLPGVLQAIWLSFTSIIGADGGLFVYEVSSWLGRVVMSLAQITNLAVLGLLIGELTAFITTRKVRLNIEGPEDLRGKVVATVRETTSESALRNLGATVVGVERIEEAYKKLRDNDVEAVVFDSPVLIYFALNDGKDWARVVGETFNREDYGIALQSGSDIREQVERALLTFRESGNYETLYQKWFGQAQA